MPSTIIRGELHRNASSYTMELKIVFSGRCTVGSFGILLLCRVNLVPLVGFSLAFLFTWNVLGLGPLIVSSLLNFCSDALSERLSLAIHPEVAF